MNKKISVLLVLNIFMMMCYLNSCSTPQPFSIDKASETAIAELVSNVSTDSLYQYLAAVIESRKYNWPMPFDSVDTGVNTCQYILSVLHDNGCDTLTELFINNEIGENLIATIPGRGTELPQVLVTAHWDVVSATEQGADDNSSACAAILEIARVIKGAALRRNVRFVIFDKEEAGLLGSEAYVRQHINEPIRIVVDLEMIAFTAPRQNSYPFTGMPSTGDYLMIAATDNEQIFAYQFCDVIDHFVPALKYYCIVNGEDMKNNPLLTRLKDADHDSFWQQKIPAMMLTDMADMRNPNYHEPTDVIETLDFDFLRKVTAATVAYVYTEAIK